jgi:uncharacterized protein (DUF2062 family)
LLRARRLLTHNILHADDTPHSLAMGVAIATFVAFLPIMGIQTIVAVAIAALFRANKAVCVPVVWISNPFTAVPIYGGCLALGHLVMGLGAPDGTVALVQLTPPEQTASWLELEFWKSLFSHMMNLGTDLWVGCAIVGCVFALLSYPAARWTVTAYREHRRRRILRRNLLRAGNAPLRAAGERKAG